MYTTTYLSHRADVGIHIQAESLLELFEAALEGMNILLKKNFCRSSDTNPLQETVRIRAPDATGLLVDFLSEVLTLSQINKAVYCRVRFRTLQAQRLEAILWGRGARQFDEDIKAVTYHEADVRQNPSGLWETNLLFDI